MMPSIRRAVGLLVATLFACGAPEETPPPETGPVHLGRAVYDERMTDLLGVPFSSEALIRAATTTKEGITARMNRLADELEPGSDWQTTFDELRQHHPGEVPDLLIAYRRELAAAAEFVRDRGLVPAPASGPEVVELGNLALRQSYPLAVYLQGRLGVTTTAGREPDPSYLVNHCDICIPPLAVHEGYPGHHVAFSRVEGGATERGRREVPARGPGQPPILAAGLDAFWVEGWGLYSELLMLEQGYYTDTARELGAWRMVLLRIVRALVDLRLHGGELTAEEAARIYSEDLQMSPSAAETEVRRHLAAPMTKATYFIGMMQLLELRRLALEKDPELTLLEIHDRVLQQAGPIAEIAASRFGIRLGSPGAGDLELSPLLAPNSSRVRRPV